MWIVMNDSYVSIVKNRLDEQQVVVRARVQEDLSNLFPEHVNNIIETDDSDYRFRLFLNRDFVSRVVRDRILDIDYDNFKNSVKDHWRKAAYMRIWQIMYDVQESFTPSNWFKGYR